MDFSKLTSLIPDPAKIIIILVLVLTILGTLGGLIYAIDKAGFNRCEAGHAADVTKVQQTGQTGVKSLEKKYEPKIREVREGTDSGVPVGPLTAAAVDSLRR